MSDFWASAREHYDSRIWQIPGFSLSYIRPDWMHVSCLGILQYLTGNVLWELFTALGGVFSRPGSACSKLENIAAVFARSLNIEKPFTEGSLGLTMFRS